ncbi:MAG: hypothetical protein HC933_09470 [Pleurocapsa sp. SU_196_0]|nr:hypothetical protein [Pleurocapsa sp. SU_196_0]
MLRQANSEASLEVGASRGKTLSVEENSVENPHSVQFVVTVTHDPRSGARATLRAAQCGFEYTFEDLRQLAEQFALMAEWPEWQPMVSTADRAAALTSRCAGYVGLPDDPILPDRR